MQKEINWLLKEKYKGKATKSFKKDVKRLEKGEPLDYVIGFIEFGVPPGLCKIDLSKKPLIPRQETEFWVEKVIEEISQLGNPTSLRSSGQNLRILDIFAGSGCIGVAILADVGLPLLFCDFTDIDKKNLKQIRINLKLNKIKSKRYKIIRSDIFKNIKGTYDYIFANPPYIATRNKNKIQKSVLEFEPKIALFGGKDGFLYIRRFLKEAKNHLRPAGDGYPDGKIYMEFDCIQKREIEKLIKKIGYRSYKFNKDQYNKWRWVEIN